MNITKILIATRNNHKVEEITAMLGKSIIVKTLRDFPAAPETVEDAPTFSGNATKKSVTLANWLAAMRGFDDFCVLSDDSGLEVHALDGAPGVHSARFAALDTGAPGNSADADNNAKLLRLLANQPRPWKAQFRCVLALTPVPTHSLSSTSPTCLANEAELATTLFDGCCPGQIIPAAKGAHGFGYDPLFQPDGYQKTFAELGEDVKNKISHRAEAMRKLQVALRKS